MARAPKLLLGDREAERHAPPPWSQTHGMMISGRAFIDEADTVASATETKWGYGRLRLLVSAELREKFDRQRYMFNQALWHGTLEDVRVQSLRMGTAWKALDRAATEAGHQPASAELWEVPLEDGSVAILARDEVSARLATGDGRNVRVYTLDEVAKLLSGFPTLARIKDHFPGAAVTDVRHTPGDPLDAVHDTDIGLDAPVPY